MVFETWLICGAPNCIELVSRVLLDYPRTQEMKNIWSSSSASDLTFIRLPTYFLCKKSSSDDDQIKVHPEQLQLRAGGGNSKQSENVALKLSTHHRSI